MAEYSKKERARYNEMRKHVAGKMGMGKNEYNALRRVAGRLSKADTNYANGTTGGAPKYEGNKILNRYEDKEHEKDVNEAFKKAGELRKKKGLKVHYYHQRDPRGASLYVGKERMKQENYPQKGHPIY